MAAGDEADQQLLDDFVLADDDARDRVAQCAEFVDRVGDGLFGDGFVHSFVRLSGE